MDTTFYSNGKLLLTAEYLVLDGAKALALPTKPGQSLTIKEICDSASPKQLFWQSFDADGTCWFETNISFNAIMTNKSNIPSNPVKETLIRILHEAYLLNPYYVSKNGFSVTTHLSFPRLWGLGTSSTLINNIAQWAKVDPFELLKRSFGGSGYDIACAKSHTPILFQRLQNQQKSHRIEAISFYPDFCSGIYFVYLNRKQSSKESIAIYRKKQLLHNKTIQKLNAITQEMITTKNRTAFCTAITQHETIMSAVLELQPIKEQLFPDFHGAIKSLGAWGGDFIMVVTEKDPTDYFMNKGYSVILPYESLILNTQSEISTVKRTTKKDL